MKNLALIHRLLGARDPPIANSKNAHADPSGTTQTPSPPFVRRTSVRVFAAILALVAVGTGCGDNGSDVREALRDAVAEELKSEGAGDERQYAGDLPPGITDNPSQELIAEWPERWCEAQPGITRAELAATMGAVPSDADAGLIPLISIEAEPPNPAGSDTWSEPGSYNFNAFYTPELIVQQLDFDGPESELPCEAIRIGLQAGRDD